MKKLLFLIFIVFLFSCKKDTEQPVDPASKVFCWLCTQHVSVNIISIQGGCGNSGFTWYDLPAVVCNMTEGGAKDYASSLKNYNTQTSGACYIETTKRGTCTKQGK